MSDRAEAASEFADRVLFPAANEIDAMPVIPRARLDDVAAAGWYGLAASGTVEDAYPVIAAFAGGCLTTTFVWMQHHGALAACRFGPEHLREWVAPLTSGDLRASVAFAGLLPLPRLRVRPDGESWVIDGVAPWVTGWGLVDVVHVATRSPEDDVVWLLVDAGDPGLRAEPHHLLAVNASATVTLHFDGVRVGAERQTARFPWIDWPARDAMGLRTNGSLALGLAERCCRMIGGGPLDAELARMTARLDGADVESLPAARAAASALAVQAASALLVRQGSGALERGTDAERLAREAALLLVFGSRPTIRTALLHQLGAI